MTGLFDSANGVLGRRLFTTTWVPVVGFGALVGVLVLSATGWAGAQRAWTGLSGDLRALAITLFIVATVVLAQLLDIARPGLIRLYEGYGVAQPFAEWRKKRLDDKSLRDLRPWALPTKDAMMPTRFGNIIRAAEQQARRYGMDAATAWPRLYVTLPEAFTNHFSTAASAVDLTVTISFLGVMFAVGGGVFALALLPWYAFVGCVAGGALVGWLGYCAAVRAAFGYGELVRAAFDVHRWLLLDAMGLARPTSIGAEREQWRQLHQLWQRGVPDAEQDHLLGFPKDKGVPGK